VLAANLLGAIAVPVNFRLAPPEATYLLADSGAAVLVTDSTLAPLAGLAAKTTGRPKGAMLTHLNLLMQSITAVRTSRLFRDDDIGRRVGFRKVCYGR
jgi:fatty-acyl-CoA synthase